VKTLKKYIKNVTLDTKLSDPEFAGVRFTIRKFSHGVRTQLRTELAPALHKIREVTERIQLEVEKHQLGGSVEEPDEVSATLEGAKMLDEAPAVTAAPEENSPKFTNEQMRAIERMNDWSREIDMINAAEVDPIYLRFGFISMEGIGDEEGNPYTADTLYNEGPEDLCKEVILAIKQLAGVAPKPEEAANLESPTTSGAAAGGPTSVTTAPNANETIGT
jgi:hypothetical protein